MLGGQFSWPHERAAAQDNPVAPLCHSESLREVFRIRQPVAMPLSSPNSDAWFQRDIRRGRSTQLHVPLAVRGHLLWQEVMSEPPC